MMPVVIKSDSDNMDQSEPEYTASEMDRLVGDRIRRRRILMGLTQDQVGEALGISYQQIQKYETGANRVSAGRLYLIAQKLEVSPGWFFELAQRESHSEFDLEIGSSRLVMEFFRSFSRIKDERVRTQLLALVRTLSEPTLESEKPQRPDTHIAN